MSNFQINASGLYIPTLEELFVRKERNPITDIFTIAEYSIKGPLIFQKDGQEVTIESDLMFLFLRRLIRNAFWMSFKESKTFASFQITVQNSRLNPHGYPFTDFSAEVNPDGVLARVEKFAGAVPDENGVIIPSESVAFQLGILEFNHAVWRVYHGVVLELKDLLGDIDGFEETYYHLPFMGEAN